MTMKEDIIQSLVLALVSVVLGFGLVLLLVQLAAASSVCLTKKEARELWPRQHIYWYSKNHCWSNRRGPPRNLKIDPIKPKALASQAKEEKDYCCWPKLPRDAEGNIIEPPPTFGERWEQVRDAFRSVWRRLTE